MTRMLRIAVLLFATTSISIGCVARAPSEPPQVKEAAQALVAEAKAGGVVIGEQFVLTEQRASLANALVEAAATEATCQITCSGNKVGAIACPVGKMCQCSCPGGGPDCTCR